MRSQLTLHDSQRSQAYCGVCFGLPPLILAVGRSPLNLEGCTCEPEQSSVQLDVSSKILKVPSSKLGASSKKLEHWSSKLGVCSKSPESLSSRLGV